MKILITTTVTLLDWKQESQMATAAYYANQKKEYEALREESRRLQKNFDLLMSQNAEL